jgi:hypothetical protein
VTARTTIDDLLAEARLGLDRVTPAEAFEAMRDGAVLVDVRSQDERERQGFGCSAADNRIHPRDGRDRRRRGLDRGRAADCAPCRRIGRLTP